ncbi:unnamed protein product [Bursaphelenchus okinawaensis]|uniref:Uncharacterized protein n=1 Tax=Bursaphelenchus okinawaensis TaxID=465554 RepID=A0A811LRQ3_9BILA|nr:unnamed protein product [Bursaphelenchus okinawaensis]CAG9127706.1 unnamed protein product [Bursaphelenchus okinawaensis]
MSSEEEVPYLGCRAFSYGMQLISNWFARLFGHEIDNHTSLPTQNEDIWSIKTDQIKELVSPKVTVRLSANAKIAKDKEAYTDVKKKQENLLPEKAESQFCLNSSSSECEEDEDVVVENEKPRHESDFSDIDLQSR